MRGKTRDLRSREAGEIEEVLKYFYEIMDSILYNKFTFDYLMRMNLPRYFIDRIVNKKLDKLVDSITGE